MKHVRLSSCCSGSPVRCVSAISVLSRQSLSQKSHATWRCYVRLRWLSIVAKGNGSITDSLLICLPGPHRLLTPPGTANVKKYARRWLTHPAARAEDVNIY